MKSISAGLVTKIAAVSAVSALGGHRVDISRVPMNNTLPSVTVNRTGGDPFQTLGTDHDSLVSEDFDIRVWAATGDTANSLLEAIVDDLTDFEGNIGSDRNCQAVIWGGMPSLDVEETDLGVFHVAAVPVMIQHKPQ